MEMDLTCKSVSLIPRTTRASSTPPTTTPPKHALSEADVTQYLLDHPDFVKAWLKRFGTASMIPSELLTAPPQESTGKVTFRPTLTVAPAAPVEPIPVSPKSSDRDRHLLHTLPSMTDIGSERNSLTLNMFKSYVQGERMEKARKIHSAFMMSPATADSWVYESDGWTSCSESEGDEADGRTAGRERRDLEQTEVMGLHDVDQWDDADEEMKESAQARRSDSQGDTRKTSSKRRKSETEAKTESGIDADLEGETELQAKQGGDADRVDAEGDECPQGDRKKRRRRRRKWQFHDPMKSGPVPDLQHMSEDDRLLELIKDISSELDVNILCHKILRNVSTLTGSDRGSLFLARGSRESRWLVSKLFDVTATSALEECAHTEANEIKVPFGKGIAGMVAASKKPINIKEAYEDPRFNKEIDTLTGYRTHSILCMPILNSEDEVVGVAQIINKVRGRQEFTKQDEDVFKKYLAFCGIGILNAQLFEMSVQEYKRNQLLLHLARGVFEEQSNLNNLVEKIMKDAQDLLKCEKCTVFLLEAHENSQVSTISGSPLTSPRSSADIHKFTRNVLMQMKKSRYSHAGVTLAMQQEDPAHAGRSGSDILPQSFQEVHFAKVFDLYARDDHVSEPTKSVLQASRNTQFAKHVVITGVSINVAGIEGDERFTEGTLEDDKGFKTRDILCTPISNHEKRIIGATLLVNKENGLPFNENDEHIIEAFSIFTGLGIHNCQMYENACRLMAKQSVALEVLSYHATATKEEADKLMRSKIPSAVEYQLYDFSFDDMDMSDFETLKAVIRMFLESGVIEQFNVPYEVLCRWTCSVKKNYRPVTYHNWRHALNVCQTMFTMLYIGDLSLVFNKLEIFALLAACLCHDLDHRGTNNAFQVKVFSPLAMLYSTSVLEHHHFDHCIMILNSEGNNIFQTLSPDEYRSAIRSLEHAILSTDLAVYFKKRGDFKKIVEEGESKWEDPDRRDLLKAMMMTACDVAAICKPWKVQQSVAQLVANEFFEQGDIEREQLGENPIPMMDRAKKDELPRMQVGFIDAICMPVYEMFADKWEKLRPLHDGCKTNRAHWQALADGEDTESEPQPPGVGASSSSSHSSPQPQQAPSEAQTEAASEAPSSPHTNTHNGLSSRAGNHTTHKTETPTAVSKASSVPLRKSDLDSGNASLNAHKHSAACPPPPTSAKSLSAKSSGKQKSGFCILT